MKVLEEKARMYGEGNERPPAGGRERERGKLLRALELLGLAGFVATVAWEGPEGYVGPLLFGAGFVALVVALHVADERLPSKAAAPYTPDEWLEDARASYARGTHISTLAVRYDVEPEWLAKQLDIEPRSSPI